MKSLATFLLLTHHSAGRLVAADAENCRCFPGDPCWPTDSHWTKLNSTLGGRLIRTVPIGAPCHDPNYNEEACQAVRAAWNDPDTHLETSHSPMSSFWAALGESCDPFADRSTSCGLGGYPQYVVNVSSADDASQAVRFASEKNIRFVIRNTGHDYLGKSTGAGSLAVWTHHLRSLEVVDWEDKHYVGKAIKMGAGVLGHEAVSFATQHDLLVVSGNGPTVGIAGGYTLGGGHSSLSSKYGLSADRALEYEVIDGKGEYLVANREKNQDLYWALSGGGGGSYAVVLSTTVKADPNVFVTLGTLKFSAKGLMEDDFIGAIEAFHLTLPALVAAGCQPLYSFGRHGFDIMALSAPDLTPAQVDSLLEPFLAHLDNLGVDYEKNFIPFPNYGEFFKAISQAQSKGVANAVYGGSWFIPRNRMVGKRSRVLIEESFRLQDQGAMQLFMGFNLSTAGRDVDNSVHGGWREMLIDTVFMIPTGNDDGAEAMELISRKATKLASGLQKLAPHAGTYASEADPNDPDWKQNFYGENYGRLLDIKRKYDPDHVFYGITAVGGDLWSPKSDGRLCQSRESTHTATGSERDEL
ncbi:FAD/FMN-containing isoamyl alcohol oxidase MreA [Colletotrichum higginsianum]|uniref:FAD/FMN-containing isoamyl alcohol oxidase MreA n=1 Tax=Colletotrichum higginsianum (strain IMI 349063) TaxID=759273 RepID=H1V8N4_COLHI|nr:FAD/FMN-containing isoamyl alcohol oxidase MreA [Colletotrichum higginsianum]